MEEKEKGEEAEEKLTEKKRKKERKEGGIAAWGRGIRSEFRKISWPDRKTVARQAVTVIIIAFILGVLIAVSDFVFQYVIDFVMTIGG